MVRLFVGGGSKFAWAVGREGGRDLGLGKEFGAGAGSEGGLGSEAGLRGGRGQLAGLPKPCCQSALRVPARDLRHLPIHRRTR